MWFILNLASLIFSICIDVFFVWLGLSLDGYVIVCLFNYIVVRDMK